MNNPNTMQFLQQHQEIIAVKSTSTTKNTTQAKNFLLFPRAFWQNPHAVAKSTAERGNSNNLYTANNRALSAFFVCSIRTPQARPERLSMVGRNGQPLAVGCVPCIAVFHPVTSYRPSVETLRGSSLKFLHGDTAMRYKFLCANRTRPHFTLEIVAVTAHNHTDAKAVLARDFILFFAGKIPQKSTALFSQQGGASHA